MDIRITLQDQDARATLQRLVDLGTDLSPITGAIAAHLKSVTEEAFEGERDPATGEPWPDLAEATLSRRSRSGNISRTTGTAGKLQVGRRLLDSIVADHDHNTAVAGSNLEYATTHQFGAKQGQFGTGTFKTRTGTFPIPWGDVPARPFLGIGKDDEEAITRLIVRHMERLF